MNAKDCLHLENDPAFIFHGKRGFVAFASNCESSQHTSTPTMKSFSSMSPPSERVELTVSMPLPLSQSCPSEGLQSEYVNPDAERHMRLPSTVSPSCMVYRRRRWDKLKDGESVVDSSSDTSEDDVVPTPIHLESSVTASSVILLRYKGSSLEQDVVTCMRNLAEDFSKGVDSKPLSSGFAMDGTTKTPPSPTPTLALLPRTRKGRRRELPCTTKEKRKSDTCLITFQSDSDFVLEQVKILKDIQLRRQRKIRAPPTIDYSTKQSGVVSLTSQRSKNSAGTNTTLKSSMSTRTIDSSQGCEKPDMPFGRGSRSSAVRGAQATHNEQRHYEEDEEFEMNGRTVKLKSQAHVYNALCQGRELISFKCVACNVDLLSTSKAQTVFCPVCKTVSSPSSGTVAGPVSHSDFAFGK